ncbi:hypothetical protein MRB53_031786 [Persea americana]|uniref:Uncharacterized protein n=1 Tax=Persea americana TaxID=3435 RepID=A0ACC2KQD9_PERAE|nr:hypothetical protein MRB53_031786 [Persea americana]
MSSSSCPPNYVAGLGRGATGFTTRSDIGPAHSSTRVAVSGLGRGLGKGPEEDEFEVNGFEREAEADEVEVNDFELEAEAGSHGRASNPNITEQFADLKRKLGDVSAEEWESIPEISDY